MIYFRAGIQKYYFLNQQPYNNQAKAESLFYKHSGAVGGVGFYMDGIHAIVEPGDIDGWIGLGKILLKDCLAGHVGNGYNHNIMYQSGFNGNKIGGGIRKDIEAGLCGVER